MLILSVDHFQIGDEVEKIYGMASGYRGKVVATHPSGTVCSLIKVRFHFEKYPELTQIYCNNLQMIYFKKWSSVRYWRLVND
jgi:hypothetical protein